MGGVLMHSPYAPWPQVFGFVIQLIARAQTPRSHPCSSCWAIPRLVVCILTTIQFARCVPGARHRLGRCAARHSPEQRQHRAAQFRRVGRSSRFACAGGSSFWALAFGCAALLSFGECLPSGERGRSGRNIPVAPPPCRALPRHANTTRRRCVLPPIRTPQSLFQSRPSHAVWCVCRV